MARDTLDHRPGLLNNAGGHITESRRMLMNAAKLADEAHATVLHKSIMNAVAALDDAAEAARCAAREVAR